MLRDELLAMSSTDIRAVTLPGGKVVYVRSLSVADTERAQQLSSSGDIPAIAAWVVLSACDEKGDRLFTDEDAEKVKSLPAKIAKPICEAALDLNGFTEKEVDKDSKN